MSGESRIRGHRFKVRGEKFGGHLRSRFFREWVVVIWNKLPEEVIDDDTITMIEGQLDSYLGRKGVEGYRPNAGKQD